MASVEGLGYAKSPLWMTDEDVHRTMIYELTKHARLALGERGIQLEWLERTLAAPDFILPEPDDPTVERRFRRIPEFGDRVLRVAVNTTVEPMRVVSVFFDRTMKGKR